MLLGKPAPTLVPWKKLRTSKVFGLHLNMINISFLEHPLWCSVCDPAKIFLTFKFSYLLFCNPTHKTETGTANRWELLIANHLDNIWLANRKQGPAVRSYLLHSSITGAQFCCACYQPEQFDQICRRKTIFLSQIGICSLFFIWFECAGSPHIEHWWGCS